MTLHTLIEKNENFLEELSNLEYLHNKNACFFLYIFKRLCINIKKKMYAAERRLWCNKMCDMEMFIEVI